MTQDGMACHWWETQLLRNDRENDSSGTGHDKQHTVYCL